MKMNNGIIVGGTVLIIGIALLFIEATKYIAPFLIGFGLGKLAVSA